MLIIYCFIHELVYFCAMKVCHDPRFSIYIYGDEHPPPHCHVRFKDNSSVCVTIPLVEPMYGALINRKIREVIER